MGKRIPEEVIEQIKTTNDIVDIIGEYVSLKKQGKNFVALCPFHDEKTPSFSVAQEKQIFHCFGCKKGGNVITFLMEIENFTFQQAVQFLAERSGIQLPVSSFQQGTSEVDKEQTDVLVAYEWLTRFYHHLLKFSKEGKVALQYLKQRGITDETIDTFKLGYAPTASELTTKFLLKKGFEKQFLIHQGLLTVHESGAVHDPFRGRIIFPIRNHIGKTIAFGGRTIQDGQPKYINSSESKLFQKNKLLYNFDLARKHARQKRSLILFEGQMDVITAYQAGVKYTIATLGTALTSYQARLLNRYVQEVIICYDADDAGLEATYRAANLLRQYRHDVRIVHLPDGYDPDDYIKAYDGEKFLKLIKNSETYISFYMRYLKNYFDLSIESDRITYLQNVLKQLAMVKSVVEREYYLKDLSNTFNVSLTSLMDEVQTYEKQLRNVKDKRVKDRYTSTRQPIQNHERLLPAHVNAERKLIAYMLQNKYIALRAQDELGANFNFDDHKVIATHLYGFYEGTDEPNISLFIQQIDDEKLQRIVTELGMIPLNEPVNEQEIDDYIATIRRFSERSAVEHFIQKQKEAEQANDPIKAAEIAMKIIELKRNMKEVK